MMNAIEWPQGYLPGTTDNFVSNEAIVAGLTTAEIWPFLAEPTRWPSYYADSANVRFPDGDGPALALGRHFSFETFGFLIKAEVVEYVAPARGVPGRVAWHGWGGEGDGRLDVHHAWLVEDLAEPHAQRPSGMARRADSRSSQHGRRRPLEVEGQGRHRRPERPQCHDPVAICSPLPCRA